MNRFLRAVVCAFVLALCGAAPADAQQPAAPPTPPAQDAGRDDADDGPCPDAMTQPAMNRCAAREFRKADAELNRIYRLLMNDAGPAERAKLRAAQLADEDLVGSVPLAKNVGAKTAQNIGGGSDLRQRYRWRVALEIDQLRWLARVHQQHARVVQRIDFISPDVFRQTAVSIRGAFSIISPQHNVPILARAGNELSRLRDGDGMNFVGVTAQHLIFAPVARIPQADGLIGRRRD